MLTRWQALMNEVDRNERIAEAAVELVAAMDHVLGPGWRETTLGLDPENGDEVNWAWDELVAAIEGGKK